MVQDLFIIGDKLKFFLQRLAADLDVPFSTAEIDRVFKDEETDQISEKSYCFYSSKRLGVTGVVDDHEPETIWIQVRGRSNEEKAFLRLADEFRLLLGPGPIY